MRQVSKTERDNSLFFFFLKFYFWLHRVFTAAHGFSLVAARGGPLFIAGQEALILAASPAVGHGLQALRL